MGMHGRFAALATMAAALVCAGPLADDARPQGGAPAGPATASQIEGALLAEMNRVRTQRGRVALRPIASLRRPARAQSRYLRSIADLRHESSDGSPFWTRLLAAGYPANRVMAENLAMVSGCEIAAARRTVALWMRSPGHRANLLDRRVRFVGTGAASTSDCSATYITADYGS